MPVEDDELNQLILRVILVLRDGATHLRRFARHVAVVVVLVGEVGVFHQLIGLVKRRSAVLVRVYPVADGIVGVVFQRI